MNEVRSKARGVMIRKVRRGIWLFYLIMSVAVLGLLATNDAVGQMCTPPPPDMVSWWPGDGNADDIQNGNDGTLQNGATFATGKVGQAFDFNGTNYVEISHRSNLQPTQITLDGWIKPVFSNRPFQTFDTDTIIEQLDRNLGGYALFVNMDPTAVFRDAPGVFPLGTPAFYLNVGGIDNQIFSPVPLPNDGAYHHVAATYDGSMMRLFLDGAQVADRSIVGPIVHAAADVFIGRENLTGPRNSRAAIDEVEIFSRALSATEIQAIYNAGSAGKCKAATVLDHFKCYEAKGDSPNVTVDLEDQFGVEPGVLVEEPKLFCNPVDKNGEGIRNPAAHLTCYEIEGEGEELEVQVDNQFGVQTLKVEKPELLCVPSDKIDVIPGQDDDEEDDEEE